MRTKCILQGGFFVLYSVVQNCATWNPSADAEQKWKVWVEIFKTFSLHIQ